MPKCGAAKFRDHPTVAAPPPCLPYLFTRSPRCCLRDCRVIAVAAAVDAHSLSPPFAPPSRMTRPAGVLYGS